MRSLACAALALGLAAADLPETRVLMLSGQGKDDAVPWEFLCTAGRNSSAWTTIPVPSSWECQGFGAFGYQQDPEPREEGRYRRSFTLPADWQGQAIRLVFEGVQTDTTVRVNGHAAGDRHIGGFYRFAYDISALVAPGSGNRIEVDVAKRSSDDSVNRAERTGDYWNFSGIIRPVYLECDPPRHLERVAIDARADGSFTMEAFCGGTGQADGIEAIIQTLDGAAVGSPFSAPLAASGATRLSTSVHEPRPWSAEDPALYQVETRLRSGAQVLHRKLQRFGFRTIELRPGDGIYVNRARVILQGTCRHSFWPDSGRTTSPAVSRLDITLMKEMNANAVRMSHYPPDQHFLDLCDELGLYVLDELGGWQKSYATPIGRTLVGEMVVRDRNHPCILFWDNGNEGGWNTELDDEFARWDPQHRQVVHPWTGFRGLNTKHYPTYSGLLKLSAGSDVFMPTEFLHGLFDGGGGAGMEDYWPLLRGPRGGGGFVWAWLDEGVKRVDQDGRIDVHGNMAPDGIVGPYREKEASYFTLKRLWSPVQIPLAALPDGFAGDLPIENRYAFTDLARCRFTWELRALRTPADADAGHLVTASGGIASPPIPPGGRGTLHLDLPQERKGAEVLALTGRDPQGRELWTWTWPLATPSPPGPTSPTVAAAAPTLQEEATALVLTSGDLTLRLDRTTGYLVEARRGAAVYPLSRGPRPTMGSATLTGLVHRLDQGDQVVEATYSGDLVGTRWRLGGNGVLHLDYSYRHEGPVSHLGVGFDLPADAVRGMRWCGQGPYRVYKNRLLGGTLDVWDLESNDTQTGFSLWRYPETRGYYAEVRWLTLRTPAGPLTLIPRGTGGFVQVLTPTVPSISMKAVAEYPATGLALLDAIAPMGNKFHAARDVGPQSQPTLAHGTHRGAADIRFGSAPR